jgi:hypothetical protein
MRSRELVVRATLIRERVGEGFASRGTYGIPSRALLWCLDGTELRLFLLGDECRGGEAVYLLLLDTLAGRPTTLIGTGDRS